MTRPRLAVLDASHRDGNTRRNFRRELDADLVEFAATEREFPESYAFDGVIITGSRASVYREADWIEDTHEWVDGAIDRGIPCLGICWGHQLLASVLGGEVGPMGEYEIGYRTVEHDGSSRLFEGIDREFVAFMTHSDEVVELPPDAKSIAENDYSIQAFRTDRVFGVQFHPEYDPKTAREVTCGKEGTLDDERLEAVLEGITEENYRAACEVKQLFENFLVFVKEVRAAGGSILSESTSKRSVNSI